MSSVPGDGTLALDVDAVIVAHNAGDLLQAAVGSLLPDLPLERVIVVDAESNDGSTDRLREARPGVRVERSQNRGFSASNNVGIALTNGRFVLLLNPDAQLEPGALRELVSFAELHARAGIVGPAILNADRSLQANAYGRFPTLAQAIGLRTWRLWQRIRGNRALSPRGFSTPTRVDWLTGACMLVRREAIEAVGPMDEGFFLYYEDVDWCHRMHDAGWEVAVVPAARCVHHLGQSGASSARVSQAYRDSFSLYTRRYGLWGLAGFAGAGLAIRRLLGGRD
jgi:N-acetylglucosaminyl-diphospho-decaprenol L-rhamnosyltransferase